MNVDISPNFPPMSSCTAAAPLGSGSVGGGSSTPSRSMRWIMWGPSLCSGRRQLGGPTHASGGKSARRPLRDANFVAEADGARNHDVAPDPERHVVLAAQRRERLECGRVGAARLRVARGDD